MAKQNETNTICECRYALEEDLQETQDSSNNIPNIHEIDEAESETEEMAALDQPDPFASNEEGDEVVQKTKDTSDNESMYIGESFFSDESCDESEVTNVTSGSLNTSSLIHITDLQLSQSSKEQDIGVSESSWKDNCQDESYLSSDELSRATTADRDTFTKSRKCRRWNMSFTDEEMRKIERENELLLRKIMAQQKPRHKILGEGTVQSRTSSSAINRKKLQKKIENDNMLLLRRIQQAKSCVFTNTSKMGCRLTFL
ncbi:hypothetical protein ALC60_03188 [Trachymyrmex zeteki]|uniref:Uncharacterized protein n=1 Tax=Mycetomoellerius zeteki TaxID=64791 RepID=A0A151XBU2_9HYME|nr:PREDICTED: cilia- and flagella-associated protein 97-like [Trachymyrmex zeteki]KYQ57832.1 hypothetical protein ALC60_03188 [Trachymyrmex zeteki]